MSGPDLESIPTHIQWIPAVEQPEREAHFTHLYLEPRLRIRGVTDTGRTLIFYLIFNIILSS